MRKTHQDDVRTKIQTSQLVNRLTSYALNSKGEEGGVAELSAGQLKAIEILLRKSLPDLQAISLDAQLSGKIVSEVAWNIRGGPGD